MPIRLGKHRWWKLDGKRVADPYRRSRQGNVAAGKRKADRDWNANGPLGQRPRLAHHRQQAALHRYTAHECVKRLPSCTGRGGERAGHEAKRWP